MRCLLAAWLVAIAVALGLGQASGNPGAAGASDTAKPRIVSRPIPFPRKRKREMRAYAERHYGLHTYRLTGPRVIVEHWTAGNSFSSAYNTFAADVPDPELHELPGTCAHFVIDSDGTIYQLVPLGIMCRHTVGLNYTSIGIEHVGTSDAAVLGNRRVLRSSLRLTRWLRCRFGIGLRDVIGHNESLSSRFHMERVRRLRTQTHGDMRRASMRVYRRKLRRLACASPEANAARLPYSRSLLVVGDSLAVGTQPYIKRFLRGWRVLQRVAISTQASEGPGILRGFGRRLPRVIFMNLGTNGDPRATGTFLSAIRRTMKVAGPRRCVVWSTIVRPPVGGAGYQRLNRVLARQARKRRNLIPFRWVRMARRHPGWFAADHVHVTATAYRIRARAMARRIRRCRKLALDATS